ncbi:MAG: hypothetical protein APF82_10620 [Sphingomonadales bacterium BRH_c42]|nr:MAG: hypothetical protein APF82_10620 [Sphingomonadales bacterium BRH_c42]
MRKALFLGIALLPGTTLANEHQFDLECVGEQKVYRAPAMRTEPFAATYHIDLAKSEYCINTCEGISEFHAIDSLRITLIDVDVGRGTLSPVRDKRVLDRRTGELSIEYLNGITLERLIVAAQCRRMPFTPFPETQF